MSGVNALSGEPEETQWVRALLRPVAALLRMYAGIFFSDSRAVGALVLLATMLSPLSGLLALLAIVSAWVTARLLGLLSDPNASSVYAYSALFLGLAASHTFARIEAAFALATFGAAAAALLTAAFRGFMLRFGLPSLSLPFLLIYYCAISVGRLVGAHWAPLPSGVILYAYVWPAPINLFLESLGALLFTPRSDVGLVVFAGLCLRGRLGPQLALIAFGITLAADLMLGLTSSGLWFTAFANAIFAALALGNGFYPTTLDSFGRAALGIMLCLFLTLGLSEPLGRLGLVPLGLPFNLSIFAVLLIDRQRGLAPNQPAAQRNDYEHA
jgi:urea transporter